MSGPGGLVRRVQAARRASSVLRRGGRLVVARAVGLLLPLLLPSLVPLLVAQVARPSPSERRMVGEHVSVLLDFDAVGAARRCLEVGDEVWRTAVDRIGATAGGRRQRVVHVFRTRAAYERACDRIVRGRFKRNGAFSSFETGNSYVLLEPEVPDAVLARIGIPYPTLRLVMHEVAHLAVYDTFDNFRAHPRWVSEGLATLLENETAERLRGTGAGVQPRTAEGYLKAKALLAQGRLPDRDEILDGSYEKDLRFYETYAVERCWLEYLAAEHSEGLGRFLVELRGARRLPVGDAGRSRLARMLREAVPSDWWRLDRGFVAWLETRPIGWIQEGRSLDFRDGVWVQTAFPDLEPGDANLANAFHLAEPLTPPYRIRGTLEILDCLGEHPQGNVLLGRKDETTYVSVTMLRDPGWTNVFVRDLAYPGTGPGSSGFRCVADTRCDALEVEGRHGFEVRVAEDGEVVLLVDGSEAVRTRLPPDKLTGPWGLGVQDGATVLWRGVTAEPWTPHGPEPAAAPGPGGSGSGGADGGDGG